MYLVVCRRKICVEPSVFLRTADADAEADICTALHKHFRALKASILPRFYTTPFACQRDAGQTPPELLVVVGGFSVKAHGSGISGFHPTVAEHVGCRCFRYSAVLGERVLCIKARVLFALNLLRRLVSLHLNLQSSTGQTYLSSSDEPPNLSPHAISFFFFVVRSLCHLRDHPDLIASGNRASLLKDATREWRQISGYASVWRRPLLLCCHTRPRQPATTASKQEGGRWCGKKGSPFV